MFSRRRLRSASKLLTLLLLVRDIVDKKTSSCDTFLCPMTDANTVALAARDLIRGCIAVPCTGSISHVSAEMAEPIPLRTSLWIETPDIIPGDAFIVWYRHDLVLGWESVETCSGVSARVGSILRKSLFTDLVSLTLSSPNSDIPIPCLLSAMFCFGVLGRL